MIPITRRATAKKVYTRIETGSGQIGYILYGSIRSDQDLAFTALLEYFNILAGTLKV